MASASSILNFARRSRGRSFFLPREHGAWGMLLVPLAAGTAAGSPHGHRIIWILLFAAVALGLFCLRTPVEAALGLSPLRPQNDGERRLVHFFIYIYSSVVLVALAVLILSAHAYGLLLLGAAAATAFLFQAILKQLGRNTRMNAQLTGAIALSSTAAGAYYLATGHFGLVAIVIWLANWIFSADQIHFVQLRIHTSRAATLGEKLRLGKGFLIHQAFSLLFLALIWRAGWLPGFMLIAFGPLFVRGIAWFFESPRPLQVRRLGITELLYAVVFGLFFIAGFHHQIR
jgi:predicted secreted protein